MSCSSYTCSEPIPMTKHLTLAKCTTPPLANPIFDLLTSVETGTGEKSFDPYLVDELVYNSSLLALDTYPPCSRPYPSPSFSNFSNSPKWLSPPSLAVHPLQFASRPHNCHLPLMPRTGEEGHNYIAQDINICHQDCYAFTRPMAGRGCGGIGMGVSN